jgi:O-antigen/teichoic acid export membrane protein
VLQSALAVATMLAKFGSVQLLGRFLPGLIGFVMAAVLTRFLPPGQYGTYGLALALSQLFALSIFGWLGLSVTRLATGRSVDARFATSVFAVFAALIGLAGLASALSFVLPLAGSVATVAAAAAAGSVVFAYFDLISAFLSASLDFSGFFALNVIRATFAAIMTFAAAYYVRNGLAVFALSLLATLAVCLIFPRKVRISAASGIDWQLIARLFHFGVPIAASLVLFSFSVWSDRLILGVDAGITAVGFYTAATVIVQNTLQMMAQAIGSAAYPLAVLAYDSGNRVVSDRQLEQNFIALIGVLAPAAVGLSLLAPNIASVLVGPAYREAVVRLTPLLAAAALVSAIRGNFVDHAFQLTGITQHYFRISAGMAALNIVALVSLIPLYGYMGAGAAVLLTQLSGLTHAVLASRCVYRMPFPRRDAAKVAVAVLAMAVALMPFARLKGVAILSGQITLGLAVYIAALWSLNLLNLRQSAKSALLRWLAARS